MSNITVSNATISLSQAFQLMSTRENTGGTRRDRTVSAEGEPVSNLAKLDNLQITTIPPTVKKIDSVEINQKLSPLAQKGLIRGIGAIPKDRMDPRVASKAQKSLANFTCNQMTFSNFGKDGEFFNLAKAIPSGVFDNDKIQEYIAALYASTLYIGSSGSLSGLLTRLSTGMLDAPRVRLDIKRCVLYASKVLKYKPVEVDFEGKSLPEVFEQVSDDVPINFSSNAGVPYFKKIGADDTLTDGVSVASELINAMAEGKFNELVTVKRPAWMATLIKNKQDYYQISRLGDKIRPYFVYPLHERLIYSCLQAKIKAIRFDEEPEGDSGSMVGFSWNYGGGDRLYSWIIHKVSLGPGFYPLFYGDDQLWVIVTIWGDTYICTPDFSHMDLSLSKDFGVVAYKMWRKAFTKLDKTWDSFLKMNCSRAFSRQVIIDGAMTYFFDHGLGSGVPGTTKFDEVAAASVNGYVKMSYQEVLHEIDSVEALEMFLKTIVEQVRTQFGLVFKDGSTTLYPFKPDEESYDFVMLGQSLLRLGSKTRFHYVPKPSLEKLLISATTYKKSYRSGSIRMTSTMFKIRSLYASGGYLYPVLGNRLQAYYEALQKRNIEPISSEDPDFGLEVEGDVFTKIEFAPDDHSWPPFEWCVNLYFPPDDPLESFTHVSVESLSEHGEKPVFVPNYDLEAFASSSDEEGDERIVNAMFPKEWSAQMAHERPEGDVGGNPPIAPKEIPLDKVGFLLKLPLHEKEAFEKTQNELRAQEADRRAQRKAAFEASKVGTAIAKSKGKGRSRVRAGAVILESDFDYLEEEPEDDDME